MIELIARAPGQATEEWALTRIDALGEPRYVELVGVVARTVAIDTFNRLRGREETPLSEPVAGEPSGEPAPAQARRNLTWVAMVNPSPPNALGLVPSAERAMNALSDALYMSVEEMADPQFVRGSLTRPQIELVAASTSHVNECFY